MTTGNLKCTVTKKSLLISIIIVLTAGLLIWGSLGFVQEDKAKDMAEIQDIITKAVEKVHSIDVLPAPHDSLPNEKVPDKIKQMKFNKIADELAEVYSGELLKKRINQMKGSIEFQELQKFRVTGGGVKKVENVKIEIDGEKATAEADITTWTKFLDKKNVTTGSSSHYKFTLIKKEGYWKVIDEEFNFIPGQEPKELQ